MVYLYVKKPRSVPKCGQCKIKLPGIHPTRPSERPRMARRLKTVNRSFGGVLCHKCLRTRVIRAFLIGEQKVVKALKAAQEATGKSSRVVTIQQKIAPKPPAAQPKKEGKAGKKLAAKATAKATATASKKGGKGEKKSAEAAQSKSAGPSSPVPAPKKDGKSEKKLAAPIPPAAPAPAPKKDGKGEKKSTEAAPTKAAPAPASKSDKKPADATKKDSKKTKAKK